MKILITGHEGFVGRHLVKKLEKKDIEYIGMGIKEDITLKKNWKKVPKVDLVVHLAANSSTPESIKKPLMDANINILGTINVLEYCRKNKVPLLFFSSCRVYSDESVNDWKMNVTEGSGVPPYGISKLAAEKYIEMYNVSHGLDYIILRPSTIYGESQDGSEKVGWMHHFVKMALMKEKITIYGDGNQTRDVLYIGDLTELVVDNLFDIILEKKKGINKTYDVGGGPQNTLSLNTLIKAMRAEHENKPARSIDLINFFSDMKDLYEITSWRPTTSWIDGIDIIMEQIKSDALKTPQQLREEVEKDGS